MNPDDDNDWEYFYNDVPLHARRAAVIPLAHLTSERYVGMKYDPLITVCDKCCRSACWQGEFMCDDSYAAGTVQRKVSSLVLDGTSLFGEHPDWWNRDLAVGHRRPLTVTDLRRLGIADPELLELA